MNKTAHYCALVLLFGGIGCSGEVIIPSFDDFSAGETGYLSNKAVEFNMTLQDVKLYVDIPTSDPCCINSFADVLSNYNHLINTQLEYLRNGLRKGFNFSSDPDDDSGRVNIFINQQFEGVEVNEMRYQKSDQKAYFSYSLNLDSVAKLEEFTKNGISLSSAIGKKQTVYVPSHLNWYVDTDPFLCSSNPDGDGELTREELESFNYFYYFDPEKPGCPLKDQGQLVPVTCEIAAYYDPSQQNAQIVWPEYDRLIRDQYGLINMAAVFGSVTTDRGYDLGVVAHDYFIDKLLQNGFRKVKDISLSNQPESLVGARYSKIFRHEDDNDAKLTVEVDCYDPPSVVQHGDAIFKDALRFNQLVYYNGHSGYGSLDYLNYPESYPPGTYQIIFMDSCWSYSYYTRQVFQAKITTYDPKGTRNADVINNTEMGITGSEQTAFDLFNNIFEGAFAAAKGERTTVERYSWNNLIAYMNLSAEKRAGNRNNPEIYGVSGVLDNCYTPTGSTCPDLPKPEIREYYQGASNAMIPDNDPAGIYSTIPIVNSALKKIDSIEVFIDITHTYMKDLVVTLNRSGFDPILVLDRQTVEGISPDNRLYFGFSTSVFNEITPDGDWALKISDNAAVDQGMLNYWEITFIGH